MIANYTIGDDTPWTCGDCQVAIAHGEALGHTEILIPVYIGDDVAAYMPWEPLAGPERQAELRRAIHIVGSALAGEASWKSYKLGKGLV